MFVDDDRDEAELASLEAAADEGASPADADNDARSSDGPTRDDRGRFASSSPDPEGSDDPSETPPATDPATAPTTDGAPDAQGAPAAGPPPAGTEDPNADDPDAVAPFTFRALGQVESLPGAMVTPDGHLVVPAEQVRRVQQALASSRAYELHERPRIQQMERQLQEQDRHFNEEVVKARATNQFFADLFAAGPDALADFLAGFEANLPELRGQLAQEAADAKLAHAERLLRGGGSVDEAPAGDAGGDLATEASTHLASELEQMRAQGVAGLQHATDDELRSLYGEMQAYLPGFFREATLQEQHEYGFAPGQIVCDTERVATFAQRWAASTHGVQRAREEGRRTALTEAQRAEQARRAAAQQNARRTGGRPTGAPPAAVATVTSTPAAAPKVAKDRDEWRKSMGLG